MRRASWSSRGNRAIRFRRIGTICCRTGAMSAMSGSATTAAAARSFLTRLDGGAARLLPLDDKEPAAGRGLLAQRNRRLVFGRFVKALGGLDIREFEHDHALGRRAFERQRLAA